MTPEQEAIEVADANLNNVCLPTYSELVAALGKLVGAVDRMKANAADGIADECRELIKQL